MVSDKSVFSKCWTTVIIAPGTRYQLSSRRRRLVLNGGALCVGPGDEVRDGVAGAAADRAGSGLVVVAAGDGQEDLGPEDLDGRGDPRATDLCQLLLLLHGELAERCLLVAGHAASVAREAAYHPRAHDIMAAGRPFDPRETDPGQHRDRAPIGPALSRDGSALAGVG